MGGESFGKNIFLENTDESKKIAFVHAEGAVEKAAQDIARDKMTADADEVKVESWKDYFRPSKFVDSVKKKGKQIWKYNLAREYYEEKEKLNAKKEIEESKSLYYKDGQDNLDAHNEAVNAIVSRFVEGADSEIEEELIHKKAGERVNKLSQDSQGSAIKDAIKELIRAYAKGEITDRSAFEEASRKNFAKLAENLGNFPEELLGYGAEYASNLFKVAEMAKDAVKHGVALDRLDLEFDVIIGKAQAGARTEVRQNFVERGLDRLKKSKVGPLVNETTILAATALVTSVKKISQSLARSRAATWGTFGASAAVGAGLAGVTENSRLKKERAQIAREKFFGGLGAGERREEFEESNYEQESALKLIEKLEVSEKDLDENPSKESYEDLVKALADVNARINISDREKIDLITSYNKKTGETESGRLALDRMRARVRVKLKKLSTDPAFDADIFGGKTFEQYISDFIKRAEGDIKEKEVDLKDRLFEHMKGAKVAKKMAITFGSGVVFGSAFQQGIAWGKDVLGFGGGRPETALEHGAHVLKGVFKKDISPSANLAQSSVVSGDLIRGQGEKNVSVDDFWKDKLGVHKRMGWHDEPGVRRSEIFRKLLEFEGKQQMLYIKQDENGVYLDVEKVYENLLKNAEQGFKVFGTNPDGTVDSKLEHFVDELKQWKADGSLAERLQAVVIPTDEANRKGLSMLIEGSLNTPGRIYLGKEISEIMANSSNIKDGKLPVKFLELRLDGHVLATARGESLENYVVPAEEVSVITQGVELPDEWSLPDFVPVTGRRPLEKRGIGGGEEEAGEVSEETQEVGGETQEVGGETQEVGGKTQDLEETEGAEDENEIESDDGEGDEEEEEVEERGDEEEEEEGEDEEEEDEDEESGDEEESDEEEKEEGGDEEESDEEESGDDENSIGKDESEKQSEENESEDGESDEEEKEEGGDEEEEKEEREDEEEEKEEGGEARALVQKFPGLKMNTLNDLIQEKNVAEADRNRITQNLAAALKTLKERGLLDKNDVIVVGERSGGDVGRTYIGFDDINAKNFKVKDVADKLKESLEEKSGEIESSFLNSEKFSIKVDEFDWSGINEKDRLRALKNFKKLLIRLGDINTGKGSVGLGVKEVSVVDIGDFGDRSVTLKTESGELILSMRALVEPRFDASNYAKYIKNLNVETDESDYIDRHIMGMQEKLENKFSEKEYVNIVPSDELANKEVFKKYLPEMKKKLKGVIVSPKNYKLDELENVTIGFRLNGENLEMKVKQETN